MRIGINLLYLLPGIVGGTETYASGLLQGLARVDSRDEFFLFMNRECADWPLPRANNFLRVACPVTAVRRGQRYLFEQLHLPRWLKGHGVDVVHSLGYVGPLHPPCPAVVTLPDLNYKAVGHTLPLGKRLVLGFFSRRSARRAEEVITLSNFSKDALCAGLGLPAGKVTVTYLGPRRGDAGGAREAAGTILERYGVTLPYLAAFAGGAVHKNIGRLLQAFARLKDRFPHRLLLIGRPAADVQRRGFPAGVIATGHVPAEHVLPLLSRADAVVLPSEYEGFGLPVLEAQQAGAPLACSRAGSLPEIAGDAALFFDPRSVSDMEEKVARLAGEPRLREELRQKGLANLRRFSWERTAGDTLAVYRRAREAGGRE
ncbi:MAG: glycosyltransferase family 4 protein [Candidatus Aminicenantes bacterium]|nr:glycosyltransferase family 4 protein [Candidatus Aminicenantes bacterium]